MSEAVHYFTTDLEGPVDLEKVDQFIEYIYDNHALIDLELVPVTNALQALAKEVKRLRREVNKYAKQDHDQYAPDDLFIPPYAVDEGINNEQRD